MDLKDLIQSVNIVDYISQYIELEKKGDEWWGLSCFKDENTPSFSVRENPPFFYDYSSGKGGNVFNFIKEYHHCSTPEAVDIIKKYAGYDGDVSFRHGRLEATAVCQKYKNKKMTVKQNVKPKIAYDYMDRYSIDDSKLAIWQSEGISYEVLRRFDVRYDSFSNRLVYPIYDMGGNIVNIGGRTLDPEYKAKELRKYTYFFNWGSMNVLYGLYDNIEEIAKKKELIIFEGCKSVLIAATWGIKNTAAILTSHLNPNQMKILAKLGYRVVFALDKDVRIRDDKNIAKLKNYINVEYICDMRDLLDEKDSPVDKGNEVFERLYQERFKYR